MRRALISLLVGVAVGGLLLAAAALLLDSAPGRRLVERAANAALEGTARLEGLGAGLPGALRVDRIELLDAEGAWATVEGVSLDWSIGALLRRTVAIENLHVRQATMLRAPVAGPEPPAEDGGDLPVAVRLDRFSIAAFRLEAAAPGGPASFALDGSARLPRDLRGSAVELTAQRLEAAGRLAASLGRDGEVYRIDIALDEPAGGVLARLLELADAPPLALSLQGEGPLENFYLRVDGSAGEARASGEARLRRAGSGLAFEAKASGAFAAFLPERFRPLAAPQVELAASGRVEDDGAAQLDALVVKSAAAEVQGAGALGADRTLAGQFSASGRLEVLAGVADLEGSGGWRLETSLNGSLDAPRAEWRLALDAPTLAAYAAESLSARGTVALAQSILRLESEAEIAKPMAPGTPLPDALAARLDAEANTETGAVAVRSASLDGGPYSLAAEGRIGPDLDLALDLRASARDLAALGLQGAVEASGALAGLPGALKAKLQARFAGLRFGQPQLDAALGAAPNVAAELGQDGDRLRVDRLEAAGAHARLSASGALGGGRLDAKARLTLPDLAALGAPVGGRAELEAAVGGALDAVSGPLSLIVQAGEARLSAKAQAGLDGRHFSLAELRLEGTGLTGQGSLSAPRTGGAPEARLAATLADLRPWAALFDAPAEGAAEFDARLAGSALVATVSGRRLAWSGAAGAGSAELSVQLKDLFGRPTGPVKLSAREVAIGGLAVRELGLDAGLRGQGAEFRLRAEAPATLEAPLEATGAVAWSDGERLTLASLRTRVQGQAVRLAKPASLARRGQLLTLEGLDLRVGEGRLAGDFRIDPLRIDARVSAKAFPLAPFLGEAAGALDGEARLSGGARAPEGQLELRLTPAREGLPPELARLVLQAQGQWRDGRLALTAQVEGAPGADVVADLALPLEADFAARRFALPPDGRLTGGLRVAADLAQVSALLPLDGNRFGGRLDGALTLAGTVASPDLAGQAALAGGRYDNAALGTRLRDLRLRLRGDGRRIVIEDLAGTDGAGGALSGRGDVALERGEAQADLSFQRLQLANTDELQALASGALRLAGPLAGPTLAGTVQVEEAEIAIPRRLPTSIASLDVVEINLPPGARRAGEAKARRDDAPAFALRLDVAVKAPGRVFVRGRGLDSEWRGDVHVGGTSAEPRVTGELNVVRGQFDLAGKRLELQRGSVRFPEGRRVKVEPELDVVAATQAGDLLAELRLSGPVSDIRIELSSQPSMPSDEILSRLLFGKSAGALSAAQAIQLGQTALALSGRGGAGGLLADIRQRFGLDFLDVESGEGQGVGAARLSAGKYLRDDVYVGVKQGAQAGSSSAVIEYEFLPNLSLEGTVGANSETGIGLNWERRY